MRTTRKRVYADRLSEDSIRKRREHAANRKNKDNMDVIEIMKQAKEPYDALESLFNYLVPTSGQSRVLAGELARAMMKIIYRDWNDGDVFYEGYGIETCGSAVQYLIDKLPELERKFESIAMSDAHEERYTKMLEGITEYVVNYVIEHPESFTQKTDDMYDHDYQYEDAWQSTYELEFDYDEAVPEDEIESLIVGNVRNSPQLDYNIYRDYFTIGGLYIEDYEELDENMQRWLNDLEDEYLYGEGEYDDEEEY